MNWRYLDISETDLLREAYEWEKDFPTFYKDAGCVWRSTFDEALKFYEPCILYGLFDEGEFIGLIYMERIGTKHLNIHLDLKRGKVITPEIIAQVRDDQFRQGIATGQVWVMKRNRPLQMILRAAGFDDTGLEMREGHSHGKPVRYLQMVVATA